MKAWKMVLAVALALLFCAPGMAQDEKKKERGKGNRATPEETFKKMDADGNGKVTKEEYTKFLKADERLAKRLEEDAEFANKQFDRMDGNKDGNVTLEEYKKYREEMSKNRKKKDGN
ncbi:MAG: EF-hand domain-containing protein [Gemmatales bacterium]